MELLNTASQEAVCEDAEISSITDLADTCIDEAGPATDAVASCPTTGDNCSAVEKCTTSLDPYSYVQRGDTSEVYKLELMNLPRRFGIAVGGFFLVFIVSSLYVYID